MDDLAGGVHPRVRSPGRGRPDFGLQYPADPLLQDALHGPSFRLELPAEETGAVVLDLQDQGAHGG